MIGWSSLDLSRLPYELAQRDAYGDAVAYLIGFLMPNHCCLVEVSSGASDI